MPVAGDARRPMYNNLRRFRAQAKVSRADLAATIDVNVQTIGALERGSYSPSLYLALLIADALDVPLVDLFGLADTVENHRTGTH
nr:helix-turn-helix transcriptional regulator [Rhodococcus sp. (in: high G+C Gram-positive bacteria)]